MITGTPNPKQKEFFHSTAKFTAYGGARGGGKSWALRRKLILLARNYNGIKILLVRRSYPELYSNHLLPLLADLDGYGVVYESSLKCFKFPNKSRIFLGYCARDADVLRYQGQEYDIIALDEATQLSEYQFHALKACLRGANPFPKRMYLTCNPGGIGHAWVKRLFIDRAFLPSEHPEEYCFISAAAFDNPALLEQNPDYIAQLESLPSPLREAWLFGRWDLFEGQFFSEFTPSNHICSPFSLDDSYTRFAALDYGFDMLAVVWIAVDEKENCTVYRELNCPNLTLSQAAQEIVACCNTESIQYIVASPDLWNRRQDSGLSGFEIMSNVVGLPPLIPADNRRIAGWRVVREFLQQSKLHVFSSCTELIRCMSSLTFDPKIPEDAASRPHAITHLPEALRYALLSGVSSANASSITIDPLTHLLSF